MTMRVITDNKLLRVLHVLKSSIYSGAESVVITIIQQMHDGYDMAYLATSGDIKGVLEQEGIPYYLLKEYTWKNVYKVIKNFRPDIVHAHDFTASILCASIPGEFRLISHLHHNPLWARRWGIKTLVYMLSSIRISRILTVSRGAYDDIIFMKILHRKMEAIGNPIDINKIQILGNQCETVMHYDLLFVGRFMNDKNPKGFIEIVNEVCRKKHNIKCAMLGTGELWDECRSLIDSYGLQDNIYLYGFVKNPYKYMKASRLLCITSEREGYGLVAAEANVLGIPVISTRNGGITELFGSQAMELCDDLAEFPQRILEILNNDDEYELWKSRARERREKFVTIEEYIDRMKIIYKGKGNE